MYGLSLLCGVNGISVLIVFFDLVYFCLCVPCTYICGICTNPFSTQEFNIRDTPGLGGGGVGLDFSLALGL